jgi:hypothetical protein
MARGAVGKCTKFAKTPKHDLWLPRFGSDGQVDRYAKIRLFDPLIWEPEKYPIGIDEHDEWATRGTIARPKLGLAINKLLGLTPHDDERLWRDGAGQLALKSEVWGEWKPDAGGRGSRYQDEGDVLWADIDWLEGTLKSCNRSLVYIIHFLKYKSSRDYDDSSEIREIYVGLKRNGQPIRFWQAKKASKKG